MGGQSPVILICSIICSQSTSSVFTACACDGTIFTASSALALSCAYKS